MLHKKDYVLIAGVIKDVVKYNEGDYKSNAILLDVVNNLSEALAGSNPAYDSERFKTACGF